MVYSNVTVVVLEYMDTLLDVFESVPEGGL